MVRQVRSGYGGKLEGQNGTEARCTHHAVACMADFLAVDENHAGGLMVLIGLI